jgi:hypothetical protein
MADTENKKTLRCEGCDNEGVKLELVVDIEGMSLYLCEKCIDSLESCNLCETYILEGHIEFIGEYIVCTACSEHHGLCTGCEEVFSLNVLRYNENDGNYYCESCYHCDLVGPEYREPTRYLKGKMEDMNKEEKSIIFDYYYGFEEDFLNLKKCKNRYGVELAGKIHFRAVDYNHLYETIIYIINFHEKMRELFKGMSKEQIIVAFVENKLRGGKLTKKLNRALSNIDEINESSRLWELVDYIKNPNNDINIKIKYGFPETLDKLLDFNKRVGSCQRSENCQTYGLGFGNMLANPSLKVLLLYKDDEIIGRMVVRELFYVKSRIKYLVPDRLYLTKFQNHRFAIYAQILKFLLLNGKKVLLQCNTAKIGSAESFVSRTNKLFGETFKLRKTRTSKSYKGYVYESVPQGFDGEEGEPENMAYYMDSCTRTFVYRSAVDDRVYLRDYLNSNEAYILKLSNGQEEDN